MVIAPDGKQKRQILDNAVHVLSALGVLNPKAAVLYATEVENPRMPASVDAAGGLKEPGYCTPHDKILRSLLKFKELLERCNQ